MSITGNKQPTVFQPIRGTSCHWCKHAAIGYAQKGLGQVKPSCGAHGFAFRLVKHG